MSHPRGKSAPSSLRIGSAGGGALLLLAVLATARAEEGVRVVSVDLALAPAQIDGDGTIVLVGAGAGGADLSGLLRLDTDARGKVRGTLTIGVRTFDVQGTVTHTAKASKATLVAKAGADRITLQGRVGPTGFAGTATGRGGVAKGKHAFSIAPAAPGAATLECSLAEDSKGRITGTAHVVTCGEDVPLSVSGTRTKKSYSLTCSAGRSFRFTAQGASVEGDVTVGWTASGFGAKAAKGTNLVLASIDAPATLAYGPVPPEFETDEPLAAIVPVSGSAPRGAFTVSPALPAGLVLDAATGTLSGTPSAITPDTTYTVTAENYAGTSQAAFRFRTRINRAYSLAPETRTLTDDDLRHFLLRTQFGVRNTDLDSLRANGLVPFIDQMLTFDQNGPAEAVAAPELVNASDPQGLQGMFPSATQLSRWWSSLMMNTNNPFQERMAFFWHDLFAASTDAFPDSGDMHFMKDYVNLFRYRGNGNLRDLLVRMARDPCMLIYLDGYRNTAAAPNENFAREFWELFTLGVDQGYTQADIVQSARAFTGYRRTVDGATGLASMVFDYRNHDEAQKSFLGHVVPAQLSGVTETDDYQYVVDITLDHRNVAEFIAKRVFEHFGYDAPPQVLIDEMAANLRAGNYEIAPFLKALFRSEAFFSKTARRALVKNPVELAMGFMQTTGLRVQVSTLTASLTTLGQAPTQPPTVNGWPQGTAWLSSQNMADRMNAVYGCVEDTTRQNANGMNVSSVLPPPGQRTSAQVVDWVADLMRITLTAAERQTLITYLDTSVTGTATSPVATPSTFDATIQSHLDTRLRGLLYILAQHPGYQVR